MRGWRCVCAGAAGSSSSESESGGRVSARGRGTRSGGARSTILSAAQNRIVSARSARLQTQLRQRTVPATTCKATSNVTHTSTPIDSARRGPAPSPWRIQRQRECTRLELGACCPLPAAGPRFEKCSVERGKKHIGICAPLRRHLVYQPTHGQHQCMSSHGQSDSGRSCS